MDADTPVTGMETGESTPAVRETTATPAVDHSEQSVDELLGLGSYEGKEPAETEPEGATAPEAKVEAKPDAVQDAPQTAEVPEDKILEGIASEELRQLLAKEPRIRDFYFAERKYRELFPTLGEARELRERFPTAQDADAVIRQAENLLAVERTYRERPEDFIKGIAKGDPAAFERFVEAVPFTLYESNPEMYRAKIAEPVVRSLVANLAEKAASAGDQELADAVGTLVERLGLKFDQPASGPGAGEPWRAEYEQLKRDNEERARALAETQERGFDTSIQRTFIGDLKTQVEAEIQKLGPAIPEVVRETVYNSIMEGILGKIAANSWLNERAIQVKRNGDYGAGHLQEMVNLLSTHARPMIPGVIAAVLNKWAPVIVKGNAQELNEAKTKADAKEVGNGNDAPRDPKGRFKPQAKAGDPIYNRMTPDQILNMEV